jgi:predicted ester cyclase
VRVAVADLTAVYRAYIACLNAQAWDALGYFVAADVVHNGRTLGFAGYRDMLRGNYRDIPDLRFDVALAVADPPHLAARLRFDCTPKAIFLGLPVNGRRVQFFENVFYRFEADRIAEVWSIVDKAAIEAQL